jgi:uncharacterized protein YoxC
MNQTTISVIISAATFILTIFSAVYLNQRHTDKLVEQLEKRLEEQGRRFDTKIDLVRTEVANLGQSLERFERQSETNFEKIDRQLSQIFKPILPS